MAELVETLHAESDALVADDAAGLAAASSRKRHLLQMLARHTARRNQPDPF
jgi:hypothetical protein